jgi:hypothetical protein
MRTRLQHRNGPARTPHRRRRPRPRCPQIRGGRNSEMPAARSIAFIGSASHRRSDGTAASATALTGKAALANAAQQHMLERSCLVPCSDGPPCSGAQSSPSPRAAAWPCSIAGGVIARPKLNGRKLSARMSSKLNRQRQPPATRLVKFDTAWTIGVGGSQCKRRRRGIAGTGLPCFGRRVTAIKPL